MAQSRSRQHAVVCTLVNLVKRHERMLKQNCWKESHFKGKRSQNRSLIHKRTKKHLKTKFVVQVKYKQSHDRMTPVHNDITGRSHEKFMGSYFALQQTDRISITQDL